MLLVDGQPLTSDQLRDILRLPSLVASTAAFLGQEQLSVPPSTRALCVLQGEAAALAAAPGAAPGWLLGSQDATTCVIAILHCAHTRSAWAAHLDGPLSPEDAGEIQSAVARMGPRPQLLLAGGYADSRGTGPPLAQHLLLFFDRVVQQPVELGLACVGAANTLPDGGPASRQLLVDVASGQAHPWLFADRGPEVVRRWAAAERVRRWGSTQPAAKRGARGRACARRDRRRVQCRLRQ
jgi:hypothetical protein